MKKLLLLAAVVVGLTFVAGGNTAEARHGRQFRSYGHGCYHGQYGTRAYSYSSVPRYYHGSRGYVGYDRHYGHRDYGYGRYYDRGGMRIRNGGFGLNLRF